MRYLKIKTMVVGMKRFRTVADMEAVPRIRRPNPAEKLAMDQVVLSPHIAGLTVECAERMAVASVQNVLDAFAGRLDRRLVVNAEAIGLD